MKSFYASKDIIKKVEDNPQNGRKCLQIIYLIRNLYPEYMKNSYNSAIKGQHTQLKIDKEVERHFSKEDVQMTNKHMKRSLASLAREMQVKTVM